MKVVYVDLQYAYGIKERGKNTIGCDGFLKAFEQLGNEVIPFYYDNYLNETTTLQTKIKEFINIQKPDLIFFSIMQHQFERSTLQYLKSQYITINWFGDDTWRFDDFTSRYANCFTYCITTDKFSIPKYHKIGQLNVIYSQWAAIDSYDEQVFEGYKYDVSFVGAYHPYREWFIKMLRKKGIEVTVFGNGWENGPLDAEEMTNVFVSSKINLNISNSASFDMRCMLSSLRAFLNSFRSTKILSQIKARNFEIPYLGGFQICDYVPSLEDYFDIGKEIVCYANIEEAQQVINYYLHNDNQRELIKKSSYEKARKEHGYTTRFKYIQEQLR